MASSPPSRRKGLKPNRKRVTIHMQFQDRSESHRQLIKLIILPDSMEELFKIAGENFGGHKPTKVLTSENAEIDDIGVIRDGDHLFFLHYDYDNTNFDVI
ncbi:hypothetical protein FNV43_RR07209 [Rhamnella rubrinervis]|nr:hypothetical protein FNV43_RR07209 [Rhamnella rubrinervis]